MALGTACLLPLDRRAFGDTSFPYPPLLTGMRGSHPGSFEIAHGLRDGATFDPDAAPLEERFDLIVVGAGISGLSAAVFYLDHNPQSRVLILEPNDDFGGHARRNEFIVDGHRLLGYRGTQSIEAPHHRYAGASGRLLRRLGIDFEELRARYDLQQYARHGMTRGGSFSKKSCLASMLWFVSPSDVGMIGVTPGVPRRRCATLSNNFL